MKNRKKSKTGFTLVELIMAMAASLVVLLAVAILSFSGQRSWTRTYNTNNSDLHIGTVGTTAALGVFGRKANKTDYRVYKKSTSDSYSRALPVSEPEEIVTGDAVEFRYWDTGLTEDIMTATKTATAYALFYVQNNDLKIDYGPFPPGGIDGSGNRITGTDVTTVTLIRNVTSVEFSHTTINMAGDGKGCVRMKLTAPDPITGNPKVILAATLMRNTWP
jgi:prepilin-type N-terminal cleavage/methylation domain-containing protein